MMRCLSESCFRQLLDLTCAAQKLIKYIDLTAHCSAIPPCIKLHVKQELILNKICLQLFLSIRRCRPSFDTQAFTDVGPNLQTAKPNEEIFRS